MQNGLFLFISLVMWILPDPNPELLVIAHRGVHQHFDPRGIGPDTCTAERIHPPTHGFLENTIPSMAEAFRLGADMVEIDLLATTDEHVVVFHDWTLQCRTDGQGVTEQQDLETLRRLDIGYGYTADRHRTHPFRCRPGSVDHAQCMRRNRMPTLEEVLVAFPERRLAIHVKSGSRQSLQTVLDELKRIRKARHQDLGRLFFYCNRQALLDAARREIPEMTVPRLGKRAMRQCLVGYFQAGRFSKTCLGATYLLPVGKMQALGPGVAGEIVADIQSSGGTILLSGVDTVEALWQARQFGVDGVVTERIEVIGK